MTTDAAQFSIGDLPLEGGGVLRDASMTYQCHGALNEQRDNVVLLPSFMAGNHEGYQPFIGEGLCFDPSRDFIVAVNLFGNGYSTSPSNASARQSGRNFPKISIRDNVAGQHKLLFDHLEVKRVKLVAGYSMGGQQAFQWAVSYPKLVDHLAVWCAHAVTTPFMRAFLGSVRAGIEGSADWMDGNYRTAAPIAMRNVARIYAPWLLSAGWYDRKGWASLGLESFEHFIGFVETLFGAVDANNFLAKVDTWLSHDVAATPGHQHSLVSALGGISAKTLIMSASTDLYFTPAQSREEASLIGGARYRCLETDWGHMAGSGFDPRTFQMINEEIAALLR